jgi:hypothetical protein
MATRLRRTDLFTAARLHLLFVGALDEAARIGHWVNEDFFIPQSPNFFWSADHTWCVAAEIDADSTFMGGTRELIDELRATQMIEILETPPDSAYEDHLNRRLNA